MSVHVLLNLGKNAKFAEHFIAFSQRIYKFLTQ